MARIVLSPEAQVDSDLILTELAEIGGLTVARRYARGFETLYDVLRDHPESGPGRPSLGKGLRISIVKPYIFIYAYENSAGRVTILRIIHSSRRITNRLLRRR